MWHSRHGPKWPRRCTCATYDWGVRLTVVGCSGSFPGPDSPASCYLLEHDNHTILLDLGNGALGPLQKYTDIQRLDAVLISHLHVDHFIDLCSYQVARKYHPGIVTGPIPIYGPASTGDRVAAANGSAEVGDLSGELDFRSLEREFEVGPFTIKTTRMIHPMESHAIRVEAGGRSLTYSGDTGPTSDLATAAAGTNVALFEASFLSTRDNPTGLHLTGAQCGTLAREAQAERLVVTHLVPWNSQPEILAEATVAFGECELAGPGLTIEV